MIPARFAVATHILLLLASGTPGRTTAATSLWLAARVQTNPVVVRRISGQLVRAGLVRIRRGAGGAALVRPATMITLDDVWLAVNAGRPLLPRPSAASGDRVLPVLDEAFAEAETAFRAGLRGITLGTLTDRLLATPA